MYRVIDCAWDIGAHAAQMRAAGVETVIRYYNHKNSQRLPTKCIDAAEAKALSEAGLRIGVVFQQGGGAGGDLSDLTEAKGKADAGQALLLARKIQQPKGSAIYFAVDHDYFKTAELRQIAAYFSAVNREIGDHYRIGVYGSGTVGLMLRSAGLVSLIWLAAAKGWSGTRDALGTEHWALFQKWPPETWEGGLFTYDGNAISDAWPDYGQFSVTAPVMGLAGAQAAGTVLMEVIAKSGLNLRGGPSETFPVKAALPAGTIVHVLGREGSWMQVDVQGDGLADGYVFGSYLRAVSSGLPEPAATGSRPYDIALQELALDIREVPGTAQSNPRIVMYHKTTNAGSGTGDHVAWCSSFVNYCVEQAGLMGTDSQAARSWERWGPDAGGSPRLGDIVVFSRTGGGAGPASGHVGFLVADEGDRVQVLGGNQSNRVRIQSYPKDGDMGPHHYRLLTVRRATQPAPEASPSGDTPWGTHLPGSPSLPKTDGEAAVPPGS